MGVVAPDPLAWKTIPSVPTAAFALLLELLREELLELDLELLLRLLEDLDELLLLLEDIDELLLLLELLELLRELDKELDEDLDELLLDMAGI